MTHGPNIRVSYAILLFTALDLASIPVTSTAGYCFCFGSIPSFFLELFLHWSPITYWPGEFPFQYLIILPFHTVHGVLKARILKWFAIPFSSGPHSVRPLHHDPPILGGPIGHGLVSLSYTRLCVWLDWLVFCDYGFSVSALWCPLATPTVSVGFLLPWMWGISSWLLQQSAAAAPYLWPGVSPTTAPPDLEHGITPLGPPAPAQPLLLGRGVAPLSCSCAVAAWHSWLMPLTSDAG